MHAAVKIGDSMVMLVDQYPDWGCMGRPLSKAPR